MKKIFIAVLSIAFMASCKKEDVAAVTPLVTPPTFSKNLKSISSVNSGGPTELYTYTYDSQGRISSSRKEYPGLVRSMLFDYTTAGKIFAIEKDNDVVRSNYECTLNDKGYITILLNKNPAGNLQFTYKYTYDANGYIIKEEWTNTAGITDHFEYKIENGNMVESKLFYNGIQNKTTKCTYDLTKSNSLKYGIAGYWHGKSFGVATKNLMTNLKVTNMSGVVTWDIKYSYQLDVSGYLQKCNTVNLINGYTAEDTYTFQ